MMAAPRPTPAPDPTPSVLPPCRYDEAAKRLGVSETTVYRHYADLGGTKVGGTVLIPRHVVDQLVLGPDGGLSPLQRALALLPQLDVEQRIRLAREALDY